MKFVDTIERLTNYCGGSGFESEMVGYMSREMERLGARVNVDRMGNVYARVGASETGPRVMVCAHMDEVTLIVKYIDDDGFVFFDPLGTVNAAALLAASIDIHTASGSVPGIIAARSRHLLNSEEMALAPKIEDLWIETGARSAGEVHALGIRVGDNIVFHPNFRRLANDYIASKSLDNRVGCAILLGLIESLHTFPLDYQLYLVASVQEEVGGRGAGVAARKIDCDLALVVDTLSAGEPLLPLRRAPMKLGEGPVVRAMDILPNFLGTVYSPRIRHRLTATAERMAIPYQTDIAQTWTDAATIHTQGESIPSAGIFVPRHGSHSPLEIADVSDIEGAFRLLEKFLAELNVQVIAQLLAPPGNPAFISD